MTSEEKRGNAMPELITEFEYSVDPTGVAGAGLGRSASA
jgi:hypothetical protein